MSQIKLFPVFIFALALAGCGNANPQAVFSPDGGGHPTGWTTAHKVSAKANLESCLDCHGQNLDGGISKISCTACHLGSTQSVHPLQWAQYAYARHKSYVEANGTASCVVCHGAGLAGVVGSSPACATACHLGGVYSKHPALWTQYSSHSNYMKGMAYNAASCSTAACHGLDSKGVFLSGPSCFSCHPADPAVLAPVPDKHPHNLVNSSGHFVHKQYLISNSVASCNTNICHGSGGPGPSCLTAGCHI
ncbi:MAG: hypothetical protein HY888_01015 [Deltaproteobacteria bacterium]|nr:hypothetical protein [Deltaproteobacteria bacterium]